MELTADIGGSRPSGRQLYCYPSLDFNPTLSMVFDVRLRPAYSPARVNEVLVTNGRIGTRQSCMGLSRIHNEYPYRRYEQQNQGFMTGYESYSVQTMFVTAIYKWQNIHVGLMLCEITKTIQ